MLQGGVTVRGPGLTLADHHAVCTVQSNVLDVGAPVVFNTYVLGQSGVGESWSGTAVPVGGHVGRVWLLNRRKAVMQILHAALANVAVGIFSGADCVNSVDEPFTASSHLQRKHIGVSFSLLYVLVH